MNSDDMNKYFNTLTVTLNKYSETQKPTNVYIVDEFNKVPGTVLAVKRCPCPHFGREGRNDFCDHLQ
jgi:hypothetical protein